MRCLIYVEKALQIPAPDKKSGGGGNMLLIKQLCKSRPAKNQTVILRIYYTLATD